MSILYETDTSVFISHEEYIKQIYTKVEKQDKTVSYQANPDLFDINFPYVNKNRHRTLNIEKKSESTEEFEELQCVIRFVRSTYDSIKQELIENNIISNAATEEGKNKNWKALELSDSIYKNTGECDIEGIIGENKRDAAMKIDIKKQEYLFPKKCAFYCCNIKVMRETLGLVNVYDLVIIDPPWWNKYIRRKRKKSNDGYNMLYNCELANLPIESLIHDNSLVAVWCTNAKSNIISLKEDIFKKWGVQYTTTWFWLKVTKQGEPICEFSKPPRKQPFEHILIGTRNCSTIIARKIIISVPSVLHSNKPPLNEVLSKYLPKNPKCLEIFARYLLPNTTSYGLEAIRFQHMSLYREKQH